jgi:hypothetical protein
VDIQVVRDQGDLILRLSAEVAEGAEAPAIRLAGFADAVEAGPVPQIVTDDGGTVLAGDVVLAAAPQAEPGTPSEEGPVAAGDTPSSGGVGDYNDNLGQVIDSIGSGTFGSNVEFATPTGTLEEDLTVVVGADDDDPAPSDGPGDEAGPAPGDGPGDEAGPALGDGPGDEAGPALGDGPGDEAGPAPGDGPGDDILSPLTVVALTDDTYQSESPFPAGTKPNSQEEPVNFRSLRSAEDDSPSNKVIQPGFEPVIEYESFDGVALNDDGDVAFTAETDAPRFWLGEFGKDDPNNEDGSYWRGNYSEVGPSEDTTIGGTGVFLFSAPDDIETGGTDLVALEGQEAATDRDGGDSKPLGDGNLPILYFDIRPAFALNDQHDVAFSARTTYEDRFVQGWDTPNVGKFIENSENDDRDSEVSFQYEEPPLKIDGKNVSLDAGDFRIFRPAFDVKVEGKPVVHGTLEGDNPYESGLFLEDEAGNFETLVAPDNPAMERFLGPEAPLEDQVDAIFGKYATDAQGNLYFGGLADSVNIEKAIYKLDVNGDLTEVINVNADVDVGVDGGRTSTSFATLYGSDFEVTQDGRVIALSKFANPGPSTSKPEAESEFLDSLGAPIPDGVDSFDDLRDAADNATGTYAANLHALYGFGIEQVYQSASEPIQAVTEITEDGSVSALAKRGDPIAGADNHVLKTISEFDANDIGEVAFLASTVPEGTDFDDIPRTDPVEEQGIFKVSSDGEIESIAREGQQVVSELWEGLKTIADFEFGEVDINNEGTVAFIAEFSDGTEGVLTTDRGDPGATLVGGEEDDVLTFQEGLAEVAPYTASSIGNDTLEFFTRDTDGSRDDVLDPSNTDQVEFIGDPPTVDSVELSNDGLPDDQGNGQVDVKVSFQGGDSLTFADLLGENENINELFDESDIDTSDSDTDGNANDVTDGETVTITNVSQSDLESLFGDSFPDAPVS